MVIVVVVADLKSPNVLLTERPQDTSGRIMCKVTDFGLSRDKEMDLQVFQPSFSALNSWQFEFKSVAN